jgi:hypothetical protein
MKEPLFSILIPSWNNLAFLKLCVASIRKNSTYAHEILHLFGACDLYEENKTDHISQELADYIADNYPHEIMYYTYEDDDTSNFDEITKEMSPVTLYFLDWGDGGAEIKQFPEIKRKYPCTFE